MSIDRMSKGCPGGNACDAVGVRRCGDADDVAYTSGDEAKKLPPMLQAHLGVLGFSGSRYQAGCWSAKT